MLIYCQHNGYHTLNKNICLPECQDGCHGIKRFSTGTVDKAKEQHLSSIILQKSMKKHVRSWSKSPFWQAPTLYFPTVPTAPRWHKSNARQSSWGWHCYYHYALWCDVMMKIQNKPWSCSTGTPFPNTLPYTTSCCQEKTSLAWGTLLYEAFTHRSAGSFCDTTVVP